MWLSIIKNHSISCLLILFLQLIKLFLLLLFEKYFCSSFPHNSTPALSYVPPGHHICKKISHKWIRKVSNYVAQDFKNNVKVISCVCININIGFHHSLHVVWKGINTVGINASVLAVLPSTWRGHWGDRLNISTGLWQVVSSGSAVWALLEHIIKCFSKCACNHTSNLKS